MNYYKEHLNHVVDSYFYGMEVNRVIESVRSVYYSDDEAQKRKFNDILFLADPKFPDPEGWVKKAVREFVTNPVFAPANDCCVGMTMLGQCRLVKAYRTIVKEKRKQKADLTVTIEEIIEHIRTVQEG